MIRTLNFAFIAITAFVCLGLYRIAEEARVAAADLRETHAAIAREHDALAVLGAEWARVTQPARIQALSERHLDLSDRPAVELSSFLQLPQKAPPDMGFATVRAVAPERPNTGTATSPLPARDTGFVQINTGT
jgi:hypothetical protein